MDNIWWLYLLTLLVKLPAFFGVLTLISIITLIGLIIWGAVLRDCGKNQPEWQEGKKIHSFVFKGGFLIPVVLGFISVAIPSKNDLMFIFGGNALIEIAQSETAGRIASKSVQAVEKWLDEQTNNQK